jgi:hypothetical protein
VLGERPDEYVKRYYRRVRFRLARLNNEEDELRNELGSIGLRAERISFHAYDVLVDVSLDAETEEEADDHARAAGQLVRAWRVTVIRIAPPQELWSDLGDRRREASATSTPARGNERFSRGGLLPT